MGHKKKSPGERGFICKGFSHNPKGSVAFVAIEPDRSRSQLTVFRPQTFSHLRQLAGVVLTIFCRITVIFFFETFYVWILFISMCLIFSPAMFGWPTYDLWCEGLKIRATPFLRLFFVIYCFPPELRLFFVESINFCFLFNFPSISWAIFLLLDRVPP